MLGGICESLFRTFSHYALLSDFFNKIGAISPSADVSTKNIITAPDRFAIVGRLAPRHPIADLLRGKKVGNLGSDASGKTRARRARASKFNRDRPARSRTRSPRWN